MIKIIYNYFNNIDSAKLNTNISLTLIRQILTAFLQLIFIALMANQLGPEGTGLFSLVFLMPSMLVSIFDMGIAASTVFHISRQEFSIKQCIIENIKIGSKISIFGLIGSMLLTFFWGEFILPDVPKKYLYIGLICFPIAIFTSYLSSIFQAVENFKALNIISLFSPITSIFFLVFFLFLTEYEIYGVLMSYIAGQLAGLCLTIIYLRKYIKLQDFFQAEKLSYDYLNKILKYGIKAHISNILTFINYRIDTYLINLFISPLAAGVYTIALQIAERLWIPSQAICTVLFPRLSKNNSSNVNKKIENKKYFLFSILVTTIITAFASLAIIFLLVPIFGSDYSDSINVFLLLTPGIIFWAGGRIQANYIAAIGRLDLNIYIAFIVLLINLLGNIILIPIYGIDGAAFATSIAYILDAVLKTIIINILNRNDGLKIKS